jgi:hypothetical protein
MPAIGIAIAIPFTASIGGGGDTPSGSLAITDNTGNAITDNSGNAVTEN